MLGRLGKIEWASSNRVEIPSLPIGLALFKYDEFGRDVAVSWRVGAKSDGIIQTRTMVASPTYRPTLPETSLRATGTPIEFAVVDGQPSISLCMLFLARSDTRSARNGLWHVRADLADAIPEPWKSVLTRRRTGEFLAQTSASGIVQ